MQMKCNVGKKRWKRCSVALRYARCRHLQRHRVKLFATVKEKYRGAHPYSVCDGAGGHTAMGWWVVSVVSAF